LVGVRANVAVANTTDTFCAINVTLCISGSGQALPQLGGSTPCLGRRIVLDHAQTLKGTNSIMASLPD